VDADIRRRDGWGQPKSRQQQFREHWRPRFDPVCAGLAISASRVRRGVNFVRRLMPCLMG
jgi:hypothetical protein